MTFLTIMCNKLMNEKNTFPDCKTGIIYSIRKGKKRRFGRELQKSLNSVGLGVAFYEILVGRPQN